MRRDLLLVLLSIGCPEFGLTDVTLAADIPVMADDAGPAASAPYAWSGLYMGANLGGAWANRALDIDGRDRPDPFSSEFIGGFQLGYNLHDGHFLLGIEGDIDGASFGHPNIPMPTPLGLVQASASQQWIGTLAARFGVTSDRWLAYAKAGGGWAQDSAELNLPNGRAWSGSATNSGWLLGGGLEYGFKPNWTVKIEYDYLALGSWTAFTEPAAGWNRDIQWIKVGINYKFDGGVPAGTTSFPMPKEKTPPSDEDTETLAKASQNPVATMISVPFENYTNFNTGPFRRTQDILDIEPVVPMKLSADWNVISRTIIPVTSQPNPLFDSSTFGVGDISETLFLSPVNSGVKDFFWGLGPIVTMPSASDVILGTGKTLLGPEAVVIYTPGHWVIGVLASNEWSVAGAPGRAPVNAFLAQPFINYNIPNGDGWFLKTDPIITADWMAAPGQKWTVPLGGGFGRVFKIGDQPISASIAANYNVVRPTNAADWQLNVEVSLLFPEH